MFTCWYSNRNKAKRRQKSTKNTHTANAHRVKATTVRDFYGCFFICSEIYLKFSVVFFSSVKIFLWDCLGWQSLCISSSVPGRSFSFIGPELCFVLFFFCSAFVSFHLRRLKKILTSAVFIACELFALLDCRSKCHVIVKRTLTHTHIAK